MANGIRISKISTYGHFHGSQKTARFEIENIIELWCNTENNQNETG